MAILGGLLYYYCKKPTHLSITLALGMSRQMRKSTKLRNLDIHIRSRPGDPLYERLHLVQYLAVNAPCKSYRAI